MTKKEEVDLLEARAKESLCQAKVLFEQGFTSGAAQDAYYAMFYAAESALAVIRVRHGGHEDTIELFGRRVCVEGWLDKRHHTMLKAAYQTRLQADYNVQKQVAPARVKELMDESESFLAAVSGFIAARKKEGRP